MASFLPASTILAASPFFISAFLATSSFLGVSSFLDVLGLLGSSSFLGGSSFLAFKPGMVKSTLGCPANRADIAGVRSKWMLSSSSSGIFALGLGGAGGCAGRLGRPPRRGAAAGAVQRGHVGIWMFCAAATIAGRHDDFGVPHSRRL